MADGRDVAEFEAVARVLTTVRSSNEDTLKAVNTLQRILREATVQKRRRLLAALKKDVLVRRLHNNLIGVLRSNSRDVAFVSSVAAVIALLVHESDELRDALEERGVVKELLCFLKPIHPLYPGLHLDERTEPPSQLEKAASRFEHIEVVLLALQKLIYMHRNSHNCFIKNDGIGYVLQLCQKLQAMRCEFSDQAATLLSDLTYKQNLAAVMEKMDEEASEEHRIFFKVFAKSPGGVLPLCDVYHVQLRSLQGNVAEAMIKEGVAWVGSHSRDHIEGGGEECEVCVTHVETGGHFWCQRYDGEDASKLPAMYGSLKKMPPPVSDSSSVAMATPQLGSVHAVYHDPTVTAVGMSPGGSPQGHPAWVRGCVINVRQNETRPQEVLVLAIDYGFVFSAALTQLRPLPHACQGIIHQAIPCVLAGVRPVPSHLNVLRRAVGVLCNVNSLGHRGQVTFFLHQGSVELLLNMASSADHELVRCSLSTLANLSQSKEQLHKEELRTRGALQLALECCEAFRGDEDLLRLGLKCLQAMVFESVPNRVRLIEMGGITVLAKLREEEALSSLHEAVDIVLANIMGDLQISSTSEFSVADTQKNPSIKGTDRRTIHDLLRRASNPSSSGRPSVEPLPPLSQGLGPLLQERGECPKPELQESTHYTRGQLLHHDSMDEHEFICCEGLHSLRVKNLENHVCAFLNSYTGGVIHIGMASNGAVQGISLNRHEMDQISSAVDQMVVSRVKPFVNPSLFKVTFVPVAMETGKGQPFFVIELSLMPGELRTVYSVKENHSRESCYIRVKGRTVKVLYAQQLREFVLKEEARKQQLASTI